MTEKRKKAQQAKTYKTQEIREFVDKLRKRDHFLGMWALSKDEVEIVLKMADQLEALRAESDMTAKIMASEFTTEAEALAYDRHRARFVLYKNTKAAK